ncbi:prolyl 4-hydroxylase subunit alpha-1-like isoform X2 [Drosophila teissieri]|uniref:prolyl 4-hydroxylase subunit alpha-1-like isoform X2 n=1 Tax=Drosophila teissieri TaxID=7243 RepID=UPI001CB9DB15|nr:prolyl 4-hydroxylase subunit alpha-1-like isoform X2 [Drosophila teissieri]
MKNSQLRQYMASKNKQWITLPGYLLVLLFHSTLVLGQRPLERSHSLSLVTMVPLLELERKLIDNLDNYTNALEQKLQIIRSQITVMRAENEKGGRNAIFYLSNPLNAFSLIRRLHQDWIQWGKYMEQPVGISQIKAFDSWKDELPTELDLWDACAGIERIQSLYDLKILDFINGNINGKQYNVSMSSADILSVADHLAIKSRPSAAVQWLQEVPQRLQEERLIIPRHLLIDEVEVLRLLAESHFKETLPLLHNCLKLKPYDARLLRLWKSTQDLIERQPNPFPKDNKEQKVPMANAFKLSCNAPHESSTRLHCFYNFTTTPFLRLAPLKTEQIGLHPYVVLYHKVLSAREISMLIGKAAQNMKNTRVHRERKAKTSRGRTAKGYWLKKESNELTRSITRRIVDMTGFDLADSEDFQVINYGIGGHYFLHTDYFDFASSNYTGKRSRQSKVLGDRIATVLFYLSDVEQGGATVFGNVGYSVSPQAGTAIFWYNLDTDGKGDPLTRHASCPVIVGSKWVMTEWIRERRQIFIRPCLPPAKGGTSTKS